MMKRREKRRVRGKEGQALLLAIIFLVSLTLLGFGLILVASLDTHSSRNLRLNQQALNAAEEGALMGMAYASDAGNADFIGLLPGSANALVLDSITNGGKSAQDPLQYQVRIIKEGLTLPPPGEQEGKTGAGISVVWVLIRIQSTGMVKEDTGLFSFTKPPPVQRRIEVLARVKTQG